MNPSANRGKGGRVRSCSQGRCSNVAQTAAVAIGKKPTAQTRCRGYHRRLSGAMAAAAVAVLLILGTVAAQRAQAQVESVLHSFTGPTSDGANPGSGLIMDSKGNLYGTTAGGGSNNAGTVFEEVYNSSTNSYTEKVLYSFSGSDGANPASGLIMDSAGNLYGTTLVGGSSYTSASNLGDGTVFELSPPATSGGSWTEKVLHNFTGINPNNLPASDGAYPFATLLMGPAGNLYGTTEAGGSIANVGIVFELSPSTSGGVTTWTENILYSFNNTPDGSQPVADLVMGSSGNLYGTTLYGGSASAGSIFELSPSTSGGVTTWTEKLLYNFTGSDGTYPYAGLIRDSSGNLYGATTEGGSANHGTVFELVYDSSTNSYTPKVLYESGSSARLFRDSSGNLYDTGGGGSSKYGIVFELVYDSTTNSYTEKVLHNFTGSDGLGPTGSLIMDSSGNLLGATGNGGSTYQLATDPGHGTVFGIAPVTLSATSLGFGSVAFDSTSATQGVTVTNIGANSLSYGAASLSGANAADFAITSNTCNAAVAPNGTCSASVTFTPSTATAEVASLNLTEAGLTQTVSLTGTGAYPTTSFSSTSLTFSSQDVGTTSSAQTVTLTNNSAVTLDITSVGITGDFAIASNTCKASVAAGKSCAVGVTFSPTAGGTRTGTLSFTDNASSSPQTIALSGAGADFTLTARTTGETVAPGGSTSFDLLLSPEGGFDQSVSLACSGAPAHATCTVTPTSVTLNGSSNTAISVKVSTAGNAMVAPGPGDFGTPPSGSLPLAAWLAIFGLLGLMVLVKFSPKGGRVRRAAPWATLALAAALFAGCGGGSSGLGVSSANSTPAGTYKLNVTATSGSLSQTSQVTLKVQ